MEDMDLLVGGPDRPPSKRMLAQAHADEEQRRRDARRPGQPSASSAAPAPAPSDEGWGAWATRTLNERTEKLNLMGDSMDNLSNNSKGWADDVNKYVAKQKRGLVMGAVKSKFGF
jgi:syntaxin-binding protein 5